MMDKPYSKEEDAIIDAGLAKALATREIAGQLPGRSRNSVIGRIHRRAKSLTGPSLEVITQNRIERRKARHAAMLRERIATREAKLAGKRATEVPALNAEDSSQSHPLHLRLEQLTSRTCHWPYGDNPFSFCGHAVEPGNSYCIHHAVIATLPMPGYPRPLQVQTDPVGVMLRRANALASGAVTIAGEDRKRYKSKAISLAGAGK
jgi:GcrA cell cycle regulator